MTRSHRGLVTLLVGGLALGGAWSARAQPGLDAVVKAFWKATTNDERSAAREAILGNGSGRDFDTVVESMRRGRDYGDDVGVGRRLLTRRNRDGVEFPYVVHIPESYRPTRAYPVRVYLHGGVTRPKRDDGSWWRNPERFVRDDTIVVFPTSWPDAIWWQPNQIENLAGLLNDLKRDYHVDENRVFLLGVSDGATGAYYHAFKASTPWAGFLPFIGHPAVLGNPSSNVGGEMHVANLVAKPFFVVNGGRDRLYPVASVQPYLELFQRAGATVDFRPQPEGGHNLDWWPEVASAIDAFVGGTRRDPLPDRVSWSSESTERYNRSHWLVIDELVPHGESGLGEPGSSQASGDATNMLRRRVPATSLGLSTIGELEGGAGLRLMAVAADSVFELAGVQPDDVLVSVSATPMASVDDLRNELIGFAPGDGLPIVVERGGRRLELMAFYPDRWTEQDRPAFRHERPFGRVEGVWTGNTVVVTTEGVRRFTLLLSPDQIDFSQPVRVVTNGVVSHQARITPRVDTMLHWATIDQDRSLLFGAALEIRVDERNQARGGADGLGPVASR